MTESSSSITTLAHVDIGQGTTFTVYLIQPLRGPILVVLRWPEHATEVEPRAFADVADSVAGALAIARAQITVIQAGEL
jgi:hypothetical protein